VDREARQAGEISRRIAASAPPHERWRDAAAEMYNALRHGTSVTGTCAQGRLAVSAVRRPAIERYPSIATKVNGGVSRANAIPSGYPMSMGKKYGPEPIVSMPTVSCRSR